MRAAFYTLVELVHADQVTYPSMIPTTRISLFIAALVATFVGTPARGQSIFDTGEKAEQERKAQEERAFRGSVIPMGIESGAANDHGRDTRVFTIPVMCAGHKAKFTWSGSGQTLITASYAQEINATINDNPDLKTFLGSDGKPLFHGDAAVELEFAGKKHSATVFVIRDDQITPGVGGIIGYDLARDYQWEVDPRVPRITLRRAGTPARRKAMATLPLKEEDLELYVRVKLRGIEEDLSLMPNAPYVQAAEKLQEAWNSAHVGKPSQERDVNGMRMIVLTGNRDALALSDDVVEMDLAVLLLADGGTGHSSLGSSVLNRFVYCVDPKRKDVMLLERVEPAAAKPDGQRLPAKQPASHE